MIYAALRESFEEMKLDSLRINLLEALPVEHFGLSNSVIYPFVYCVLKQKKFFLNSEVDKIIRIPLSALFVKKNHFTYKIRELEDIVERHI